MELPISLINHFTILAMKQPLPESSYSICLSAKNKTADEIPGQGFLARLSKVLFLFFWLPRHVNASIMKVQSLLSEQGYDYRPRSRWRGRAPRGHNQILGRCR
jgi:hypothetical protein